jgi:hypothetical protein
MGAGLPNSLQWKTNWAGVASGQSLTEESSGFDRPGLIGGQELARKLQSLYHKTLGQQYLFSNGRTRSPGSPSPSPRGLIVDSAGLVVHGAIIANDITIHSGGQVCGTQACFGANDDALTRNCFAGLAETVRRRRRP